MGKCKGKCRGTRPTARARLDHLAVGVLPRCLAGCAVGIKELVIDLEAKRKSRVICYCTGDRAGQETQIGDDVLPILSQHLTQIGKVERLDLFLYSRGGITLTGFALANALREFGKYVGVLVPFRAHSCATLIALAADEIVMGPFGQLGPIDPTVTTPHGPMIEHEGAKQFLPVSVEDVANYIALARKEVGLSTEQHMAQVLGYLCERISPIALGMVYRAREQIGMLASKLLKLHMNDQARIDKIVMMLTRELLSHDYIINRREAAQAEIPVVSADADLSKLMWDVYDAMAADMRLSIPWNPENEVKGAASLKRTNIRAIVQSVTMRHVFESTYEIKRVQVPAKQGGGKVDELKVSTLDEGWRSV